MHEWSLRGTLRRSDPAALDKLYVRHEIAASPGGSSR
jgi:hypothetical protein